MSKRYLLDRLNMPKDLKHLSSEDLNSLCKELRDKIIEIVSVNGGHLASNLGVVELTVAIYKTFDMPYDKIIWDVGHQCYTHKILTGRLEQLKTIRKENGLSGFPKRAESKYDSFDVGHSSTSISSAFGLVNAFDINGQNSRVIAVIGDGALSGGLAYEGLNNAGRFKKNFIVILNDNEMSISKNVGSMSNYLTRIRMKPIYLKTRSTINSTLLKMPIIGEKTSNILTKSKRFIKDILYKKNKSTIFEDMGFAYYGPVDGHNISNLCEVLSAAKNIEGPVLIHVITKKGKGYHFSEKNPKDYHGISSFDIVTGQENSKNKLISYSDVFSDIICKLAYKDKRICAITAAMKIGTGLSAFSDSYPERFFDVGIAEGHAVTFAGGLSVGGMLPIFAVYSTFLQRSYDQLIHDVALQNTKVILAVDRAGIVGEDGETHQGIFDIPMLNSIPRSIIYSPSYFNEMQPYFNKAVNEDRDCLVAIRYPKGGELYKPYYYKFTDKSFDLYGNYHDSIAIVTFGRLFSYACMAKEELENLGVKIKILKLNRIKPIDSKSVKFVINSKYVFFFEESVKSGGIGEKFHSILTNNKFKNNYILTAINDEFVMHASVSSTLKRLNLDNQAMKRIILDYIK